MNPISPVISVLLADNQAIFRAGAARVIAAQEDMRTVAECDDPAKLLALVDAAPGAILLLARTLGANLEQLATHARAVNTRIILLTENGENPPVSLLNRVDFPLCRNTTSDALLDCIRRVAGGERSHLMPPVPFRSADAVGSRVIERLTPRELQIAGLIVQGCKNKEIAAALHTQEQVIKNYLRSIYDKTGVSDRLELALFVLHHRVLAEAASRAAAALERRSA